MGAEQPRPAVQDLMDAVRASIADDGQDPDEVIESAIAAAGSDAYRGAIIDFQTGQYLNDEDNSGNPSDETFILPRAI